MDLVRYPNPLPSSRKANRHLAPYINSKNQNKNKALAGELEEPAFEDVDEYKTTLPPIISAPGMKIRIPPELMPDEETVLHYFEMYFMNVHPYVPVLNKPLFYQQWHTNRDAISPLILEAIFAIAGRLADEPTQGHQWLSLASSPSLLSKFLPLILIISRTRRLFHGCPATEYSPSITNNPQGKRICSQAGLLLSIVDDSCSMRTNGERSWSR